MKQSKKLFLLSSLLISLCSHQQTYAKDTDDAYTDNDVVEESINTEEAVFVDDVSTNDTTEESTDSKKEHLAQPVCCAWGTESGLVKGSFSLHLQVSFDGRKKPERIDVTCDTMGMDVGWGTTFGIVCFVGKISL